MPGPDRLGLPICIYPRLSAVKQIMPDEQRQSNQPPSSPNPERKTLDDRNKMSDLERLRHSCAHVFATAFLSL